MQISLERDFCFFFLLSMYMHSLLYYNQGHQPVPHRDFETFWHGILGYDGTDLLVPGPNIRDFENMRLRDYLRDYETTRI